MLHSNSSNPFFPFDRPYTCLEKIGEGTYGVVYKARDSTTGRLVALKRIRYDSDDNGIPATALREVALLLQFRHPNIVSLLNVALSHRQLHLIFEFLDHDLKMFMDLTKGQPLPYSLCKSFTFQLLNALDFCHKHRILHRDLKPQNILIDSNHTLKLADFGLARAFNVPMRVYTHEVVTLWYRAPEILLGTKLYSFGIDIWSAGCILLEMLMGKAVFPGDSEIDQLYKIFKLLGTPNTNVWKNVHDLPEYQVKFPQWTPKSLNLVVPKPPDYAFDLINRMLAYDPNQRVTAQEALKHPYFKDIDPLLFYQQQQSHYHNEHQLSPIMGNLSQSRRLHSDESEDEPTETNEDDTLQYNMSDKAAGFAP